METLERIFHLIEMTIIIYQRSKQLLGRKAFSNVGVLSFDWEKQEDLIIGAFKGRKNDKLLGELLNNNNSNKKYNAGKFI